MNTREKIVITSDEETAVQGARLSGSDQLPEDWRGGLDCIMERHRPDTALLSSISLEFASPFAGNGEQLLQCLEGPWAY